MEIARLQLENESLRRVVQAAMVNQPGLAKEHRRIRQELMAEQSESENHSKEVLTVEFPSEMSNSFVFEFSLVLTRISRFPLGKLTIPHRRRRTRPSLEELAPPTVPTPM